MKTLNAYNRPSAPPCLDHALVGRRGSLRDLTGRWFRLVRGAAGQLVSPGWPLPVLFVLLLAFAGRSIFGQTAATDANSLNRVQRDGKSATGVETPLTRQVSASTTASAIEPDPRDWTFWRGPHYNGVSGETGLLDDLNPRGGPGSNVAWKREDLGGRSTPVIMDGRLYTLCRAEPETPREGERVVCVDAKTGASIWEYSFPVYLSDVPDTRVGWSAVVADPETASVFALGVCGLFHCLDARTGEVRWQVPMHERFGLLSTYGGRTNFPILFEDLVLVSGVCINWGDKARPADSYIAFDKRTGEVVWFQGTTPGPEDTTYSSASLAMLNQQKSLVFGSGDGAIWSFQPRTGRAIWRYKISLRGVNVPPLVMDDIVVGAHSEENTVGTAMGAVIAIDSTKGGANLRPAATLAGTTDLTNTATVWRVEELMAGRSQPLRVDDRLWVFDDRAKLWVLNAETGDPIGRRIALGRTMRPSLLLADGKIYAFDADGRWAIYRSSEEGAEAISKGKLPGNDEEINGSPSCSYGRIFLQSTDALYCFHDPEKASGFEGLPELPAELDVKDDLVPFHVQIVPAEILMKPGEQRQLEVRLFNSRGQHVGNAKDAQFEVTGTGTVSPEGIYTAGADVAHEASQVTARVGNLVGNARIRVVPDLPWRFDFENGQIPVTWVGARYRHVPLDDDLFQSLNETSARAAKLYIYLHSSFVNSGLSQLTFDNTTPAQRLTAFQRYLGMNTTDLAEAQRQVDPALETLVERGVLANRAWETLPDGSFRLTVQQGDRQVAGNVVMTKITTLPKGTRSRCWFGHSDLSNYTIQADVRGELKDGAVPDIGLIAQGYTLDMMGEHQALQIRSWDPQLRMARTIDFAWEPQRWYTMKFQASTDGDRAVLRGKVWPRGEAEPDGWMLEATDDRPVRAGSPGLFGNANAAELYLDNVTVTRN